MSTATTYDRPLYAVPTPPDQQERFALLLHLRRTARRALDTLLALPRGAAGWVLRQARTVLSALGSNPILERLGNRLAGLGHLIGSVGAVPAAAAVLSIPPIWRATLAAARFLGSKVAAGASALWQRTRSLLTKLGPTGTRAAAGLAHAGTALRQLAVAVTVHPVTQTIALGVASLAGLVRPVSHSIVLHRLLGSLLGASWLRWTIELLALPLVIAPKLAAHLSVDLHPRAAPVASPRPRQGNGTTVVTSHEASPGDQPDQTTEPVEADDRASVSEPHNRAERRVQQQAQAHAKRARH